MASLLYRVSRNLVSVPALGLRRDSFSVTQHSNGPSN
jgi:hypothetical protein